MGICSRAITLLSLRDNPLSEQFAKRIAHLLREGEGFRGAMRLCLLVGDPSTKLLRSFAYGTAQDDSGGVLLRLRLTREEQVVILSNVSFAAMSPSANA